MHIHSTVAARLMLVTALLAASSEGAEKVQDWLVVPVKQPVELTQSQDKTESALTNGLIRRTFRVAPNFATTDFTDLATGAAVIRGVKPEAIVSLDGQPFEIGGLKGQPDYAYLDPAWLKGMTSDPKAFQFTGFTTDKPKTSYPWKPKRGAPDVPWPPKGLTLSATFQPPASAAKYKGLTVTVHYELYEGIPVLAKWVTVANGSAGEVSVDAMTCEILAATEQEKHRLGVESDFAFAGMQTTYWENDPDYRTQIDYDYQMKVLLTSKYPLGPGVRLQPGESFSSFRTFVLLHDSDDRERRGLARRRMYRTLTPQAMENPILMHVRQSDSASIRRAVDQCAEVGFEMVIVTFWSGFNIESEDPAYIAQMKADFDYAHGKGIEIGGYTLMGASRDVGPENNCISPQSGKPGSKFGQSACLASEWADGYFRRVLNFIDVTGLNVIETDGPYHGDVCASTKHSHHAGLADSQVRQWQACVGFYHECRKRGIYVNSPDWYFLGGSNKTAMGYRESNWSLPRAHQVVIARQNIFDGTFEKTSSMGWIFVPLVEYQGGGTAATLEPLSEHLAEYEWHLAQNFGSGVQACYRGPRLFDTSATKAVVKRWVDFYKKHRAILDSDILHVRRADGKSVDCMMHVNPQLEERALAMVYNPADGEVATTLELPLYYAGLTDKAEIREQDGEPRAYKLDRGCHVSIPVKLGPKSLTWFIVKE